MCAMGVRERRLALWECGCTPLVMAASGRHRPRWVRFGRSGLRRSLPRARVLGQAPPGQGPSSGQLGVVNDEAPGVTGCA